MRIARLINIILYLLQKELVTIPRLAEMFEVSERTIHRDIESLTLAGIPIYTVQGRNGGIGLLPNYKIDKKFLTEQDVQHLFLALTSIQNIIDSPEISETVQKLHAMYAFQDRVEQFSIQEANWEGAAELKKLAQRFHQAIKNQTLVSFQYSDRNGQLTQRIIEPYRLAYKGERWYLQAYSLERKDFRTFRLSRMEQVDFKNETFDSRKLPNASFTNTFDFLPEMQEITIKADNTVRDLIIERFGNKQLKQLENHEFEAQLRLPQTENAYRFILSLGDKVKIIEGQEFLEGFQDYLESIRSLYDSTKL